MTKSAEPDNDSCVSAYCPASSGPDVFSCLLQPTSSSLLCVMVDFINYLHLMLNWLIVMKIFILIAYTNDITHPKVGLLYASTVYGRAIYIYIYIYIYIPKELTAIRSKVQLYNLNPV